MNKLLLILFLCLYLCQTGVAQDFPYSKISQEELQMKTYAKDPNAHAVVLAEFGKVRISESNDDRLKIFFDYHIKIKILDNKGFDKGTVSVPVYIGDDGADESVDNIEAVTYYTDDNGLAQKIDLEHTKIYPEKESKHLSRYKFALPGLRAGCVIEYKYTFSTPFFFDFPSWQFQDDIPKVYSEFEAHIPAFWVYNASLRGYLKLTKNSGTVENKCFSAGAASCDCSLLVFGMSDIPAFVEEDYMTAKKNYLSAINFELSEYTSPYTNQKTKWTKEWTDLERQLRDNFDFGAQIKKKGIFKERIVPVIAGQTTDLGKAKAVYSYIQKSFKWNDHYGFETIDGLSNALTAHTGSTGDINLSLINALNAAGLNAEAVLLSTRDNGNINTLYPVLTDFDYVVAKVNIGDKSYLLDATDPLLPFGVLPLRCLNDKGRVFSMDKPSYFMDMNLPQKERNTYSLDLTLQNDGKITGTISHVASGYEAYKKRKAIKKFNSVDEYVEQLGNEFAKTRIIKSQISNLDSLDLPLGETFEVEINALDKANGDKIAFNPFFLDKIDTNPFKLAERSFPVDWGMASEDTFVLTMHMPPNMTVETPPQAMAVSLPNAGGKFLTSYETGDNSFTFSHVIQFSKSIYSPEEYPYLKELYNDIIKSEKAELIFKKK